MITGALRHLRGALAPPRPARVVEDEDGLGYFLVPHGEAVCPDVIPEWVMETAT